MKAKNSWIDKSPVTCPVATDHDTRLHDAKEQQSDTAIAGLLLLLKVFKTFHDMP